MQDIGVDRIAPAADESEPHENLQATGDRPGLDLPVPLASCANDVLQAYRSLSGVDVLPALSGARLLDERHTLDASRREGEAHCRLLPTADGVIGVNLARDSDWELMPAWLEGNEASNWEQLAEQVAKRQTSALLEQGRLLGLALADATVIPSRETPWFEPTTLHSPLTADRRDRRPRVIDLSSLWAGPLCSRLWLAAGAEVIKVEGAHRPDGARSGSPAFFEQLNSGKRCVSLDLHLPSGQAELRELIAGADIVLEASRPRALRQMGLVAEDLLQTHPGLSWVSITGYGRQEPQANWIAYGDDAAIAAGLSAIGHQVHGQWRVFGDAIADPLTGLHAALAGWASWLGGGGHLLDLSLERTVRHCIVATAPADHNYRSRYRLWRSEAETTVNRGQPSSR
ncbi:CoA transferase [Parahaliea maris]|uniref:CoA transferase n=1 Tax=Parahaliea maris TaxID=2716870 RepID=A0A5C9A012_9GAMM|nr:CoA transferase [Parahaliea maris]TXS94195.1 CoA transferase [Parahaliea maris]